MNSQEKGKRAERKVCKILTERFGKPFVRNPGSFGSGAWASTHDISELDMEHIAGDIITPKGFKFSIEVKSGYDIEFIDLFDEHSRATKLVEGFLAQADEDAGRVSKDPLVIYIKDRCVPVVIRPASAIGYLDQLTDERILLYLDMDLCIKSFSDFLRWSPGFYFKNL